LLDKLGSGANVTSSDVNSIFGVNYNRMSGEADEFTTKKEQTGLVGAAAVRNGDGNAIAFGGHSEETDEEGDGGFGDGRNKQKDASKKSSPEDLLDMMGGESNPSLLITDMGLNLYKLSLIP
jgi:hypothetical protein